MRVQVSEEELHQAFDALYGEKVECRIIVYAASDSQLAHDEYARLRGSEEDILNIPIDVTNNTVTAGSVPGIAQTRMGIPGDPLNVALIGAELDVKRIMLSARWLPARIATATSPTRRR